MNQRWAGIGRAFRRGWLPGLLALTVAALLMGAAQPGPENGFVAPLANPALAGYLHLENGFRQFLAATESTAPEKLEVFRRILESWSGIRDQIQPAGGKSPRPLVDTPQAIQTLRKFATDRGFVPQDLTWFYSDPQEFVVLLSGTVDPERWQGLFRPETLVRRGQGFSVLRPEGLSDPRALVLHVRPGFLVICPAAIEGNVLDALAAGGNLLGESWKTFQAMAGRRPALALEGNCLAWQNRDGPSRKRWEAFHSLPEALVGVQTLRVLCDTGLVKAQLFVPDEGVRASLVQQIQGLVEETRAWCRQIASGSETLGPAGLRERVTAVGEGLRLQTQGNSLFIEGPGLGEAARLLEVAALGFLADFSLRHFN